MELKLALYKENNTTIIRKDENGLNPGVDTSKKCSVIVQNGKINLRYDFRNLR